MKEAIEIKGYWFLPENPNNRVAGTLYYVPNEEIILELIGSFYTPLDYLESVSNTNLKLFNIIHGESSEAKSITLIDCNSYGSINFSCSFPMQKFSVDYVLKGIHINTATDNLFNGITVQLPLLTSWVNNYRINYSIPFKNDRVNGFNLNYDLENINLIPVQLDDDLKLEIEFTCSPPNTIYQENLSIQQSYQLNLNVIQTTSFLNLYQKASRFKAFLSFATLNTIDYTSIYLYSPMLYQELKDDKKYFLLIELFYKQPSKSITNKNSPTSYLFNHNKIEDVFSDIIRNWYSFDKKMLPILNHLIESIKNKDIFGSGDFLIVVQALEGFSSRFRSNIIKRNGKICLKDRLEELWKEFSFISYIKNLKINTDIVVESRHYYSHFYLKKANKHVAEGVELYHLTLHLKELLICCVLKETGFNDEKIEIIMKDRR